MRRTILFLLLIFLAESTFAKQAQMPIDYHVEAVQFRINDSLNIAEIYFGIPRGSLAFVRGDSLLEATFEITVRITKDDRELANYSWRSGSVADSLEQIRSSQTLFSMTSFQMKAGHYFVETTVQDLNGPAKGIKNFNLTIQPYPAGGLVLSEIELAASLKRDNTPGKFQKNGYQIIPNPRAMYGDGLPILMFYAEIYNLAYPADTTYCVRYRITDASGDTVKTFPEKVQPIAGNSLVEAGGFNIISLPSGNYDFRLEVQDNQSGEITSRSAQFFVYRARDQKLVRRHTQREASREAMRYLYRDKTESELDSEFETMRWLLDRDDSKLYHSLQLESKKDFLIRFWSNRDTDTTTVLNEFREDYLQRVRYAEENFGGFKPGWQSDRGRVILVYGMPDEVENFASSNDVRAYQIWHYYSQEGGVSYYFVDVRGWGDYELVHSTARNELSDPDWQRWLSPTR